MGDIERRIVDIDQQLMRLHAHRAGDRHQFLGLGEDFAAFDLRQANIWNFGDGPRKAKQFGYAACFAGLAHIVGEYDGSIAVNNRFIRGRASCRTLLDA
ncbi:hypothetical protein [Sphingomonas sp. KC8]|uniref:hypothetical protein n=1 Tax=Sphingomonas sp. KC8 TaxID=1030157 RepID=UPI000682083E|nr:hypothetical protein [Sphingomonas sp. KC8]